MSKKELIGLMILAFLITFFFYFNVWLPLKGMI